MTDGADITIRYARKAFAKRSSRAGFYTDAGQVRMTADLINPFTRAEISAEEQKRRDACWARMLADMDAMAAESNARRAEMAKKRDGQ